MVQYSLVICQKHTVQHKGHIYVDTMRGSYALRKNAKAIVDASSAIPKSPQSGYLSELLLPARCSHHVTVESIWTMFNSSAAVLELGKRVLFRGSISLTKHHRMRALWSVLHLVLGLRTFC